MRVSRCLFPSLVVISEEWAQRPGSRFEEYSSLTLKSFETNPVDSTCRLLWKPRPAAADHVRRAFPAVINRHSTTYSRFSDDGNAAAATTPDCWASNGPTARHTAPPHHTT